MNALMALAVVLGGAVGAPIRYLVEVGISRFQQPSPTDKHPFLHVLPWGLFVVNAVGSLMVGLLAGVTDGPMRVFLLSGICGSLTTYSGYAYAVHRAWRVNRAAALVAWTLMPLIGIGLCAAGYEVAGSMTN